MSFPGWLSELSYFTFCDSVLFKGIDGKVVLIRFLVEEVDLVFVLPIEKDAVIKLIFSDAYPDAVSDSILLLFPGYLAFRGR